MSILLNVLLNVLLHISLNIFVQHFILRLFSFRFTKWSKCVINTPFTENHSKFDEKIALLDCGVVAYIVKIRQLNSNNK